MTSSFSTDAVSSICVIHWRQPLWNPPYWRTLLQLTHWGRLMHKCVGKLTSIGSDNGLLPGRRQAIIWTNAGILLIGPLKANFSDILIEIQTFSFKKMHLKMSPGKWRPFCLGLNVLRSVHLLSCCSSNQHHQCKYNDSKPFIVNQISKWMSMNWKKWFPLTVIS